MSKSAIYTALTTATAVAVNGTIPLGATIRRFGCHIRQDGNSITVSGKGYYKVTVSATVVPDAAGTVTIALNKDGVPVAGAQASETVTAAATSVAMPIVTIVRNVCDCDSAVLSFVLKDAASSITNFAATVEKL